MIQTKIKTRCFPESNYKAIWCNGKTIRIALDPKKEITELKYPEFYDVKCTERCDGNCSFCYMDSTKDAVHYNNIIEKVKTFFGTMDANQRPFQLAYGGGSPDEHPDFPELLRVTAEELDICPNYTSNGMFIRDKKLTKTLISATKKYCGGVAISCHPHLKEYWEPASEKLLSAGIKLNFHIIISDKESIDRFVDIYNKWSDRIDYFVLLPYSKQGRAKEEKKIEWEYLVEKLPSNKTQIAFGANFYPFLQKGGHDIKVSLYEPELMSKFMDLKDMSIYPSSFSNKKLN